MASKGLIRFLTVHPDDHANSPSLTYHEHSKIGEFRVKFGKVDPKHEQQVIALINHVAGRSKAYSFGPRVKLDPRNEISAPLGAVLKSRRTIREFSDQPLSMDEVASLLVHSAGVTGKLMHDGGPGRNLRPYPSGGALFPLEIYTVSMAVESLQPGSYYFDPNTHELCLLAEGDYRQEMIDGFLYEDMVRNCSLVLLITAVFPRSKFKYGERSYRFTLVEAGHMAQNMVLVGEALGLAVVPIGGFFDRRLETFLDIDGVEESVVYSLLVAHPSTR